MSTYSIPDLMRLWRKGELTAEQAIGHILQHLEEWYRWRMELEKSGFGRARPADPPATKPPA
jgi:hypothetical protein